MFWTRSTTEVVWLSSIQPLFCCGWCVTGIVLASAAHVVLQTHSPEGGVSVPNVKREGPEGKDA